MVEHETEAENIAETSDEQIRVPEHKKYCWRDGRRIVVLGYLADQLKLGCSACKNPLNIINTMDETTQGLGSMKDIKDNIGISIILHKREKLLKRSR